jgi:protein ImuB
MSRPNGTPRDSISCTSRIACVRIPRFPIGAVWLDRADRRSDVPAERTERVEHWDSRAIALAEGTIVRAATAAAARSGVRAGATVAQARAKCAGLTLLPWNAELIGRETARASAAFLVTSPLVTPLRESPGTWWVGAGGFDGLGGERVLATTLLELARAWHPGASVAVADSCVTAYAATWSLAARRAARGARPEPVHIAPGADRDNLARVPIAFLPMDAELRETLVALGLRTAGAFAVLDPLEVERRWGADGLAAWRLARGEDARRATLARTDDPRAIRHDLATGAATMEPVLFLVRASLDRLVGALAADGLAAAAVAITLTLESSRGTPPITVTREARPARPIARAMPLFERCRALLDTWVVDAPVIAVEIRISGTAHSSAEQGDLLAPSWRDPAASEAALARLRSALGPGTVVRPVQHDSHAPERAGGWEEVDRAAAAAPVDVARANANMSANMNANGAGAAHHGNRPSAASGLTPAARLLESPETIAVTTDKRGTPLRMFWRGRAIQLTRAEGPERISGEWWHAEPFARDYWRCEGDELGQDLLLYRDASRGWVLQGWYD